MYKFVEKKTALKDKALILKSYPKNVRDKLLFLVNDILKYPRDLNAFGNPEQLKYTAIEMYSRELSKKDRIVYGIESGEKYEMPNEPEIIVFYQYTGHYKDR
jgi:Txe/YoeB family toxin of Txe-Axe toxin-antitoxin module